MRPGELVRNRSYLTLSALVGFGFVLTVVNRELPIVRNSLIYAKITWQLLAHNMKLWEVCASPALVLDKACGFPALAAPAVKLLGMNQSLKYISFLGTVAFVLAAYAFFKRVNRYFSLGDRDIPFELAVRTIRSAGPTLITANQSVSSAEASIRSPASRAARQRDRRYTPPPRG